jgi:hypothetical protein
VYHITDDGPRRCSATVGSCPYGKKAGNHFADQQNAQKEYESRLVSQYGALGASVAKKVDLSPLQRKYRNQDRLKTTSPAYRAWSAYRDMKRYTPKQTEKASGRGGARQSKLNHFGKKFIRKNFRKLVKATKPTNSRMKKLLLVKYWMPDIHSNKWR